MSWRGVEYRFASASAEAGTWSVLGARVEEALGEPFVAVLELQGPEGQDPTLLLGRDATFVIERLPVVKRVSGIVHRVEQGARVDWHVSARVHVVPALFAAKQRSDSRIFQEKTAPEIIEAVLGADLGVYGRSLRLELRRTYPRREHCVQYQETDFAFASRLMEEEGIGYFFDHEGETEVMVLFDDASAIGDLETLDGGAVPFDPRVGHREDTEHVHEWMRVSRQTTTSVAVRDFDWTQPQSPVEHRTGGEDELGRDRERYEHREETTIWDYSTGPRRYQQHDPDAQSSLRHELAVRDARVLAGRGRVIGMTPGRRFELAGHPEPDLDGMFYVTRVMHSSEPVPGDTGEARDAYHNRVECRRTGVVWRPARVHARPRVEGIQTATVVGPAGPDKIHTDEHGRIKVQFHWDRLGEWNERSSCWIRVAQPWGGPGWGSVWLPRIGMEVVVSFLEGNADRPLVTGTVYNGDNQPPYPLPDEKNRSTIKSSSNPGGSGFNELRFDDTAGSEEIWIHAQKDFNEMVLHDHTTTVLNDQTNSVICNQTESVGGVQSMSVTGNRFKTLESNETRAVTLDRTTTIGGSDSLHVTGSHNVVIDGGGDNGVAAPPPAPGAGLKVTGEYNVVVSQKIKMAVGATTITADTSSVKIDAPSKIELVVGGSSITLLPGSIALASSVITATSSGAVLALDGNAKMSKGANDYVLLDGTAVLKADGGAHVTLTANAEVKGTEVHCDGGGAKVDLVGGEAQVASGAGGTVKLDGDATVTGGTVKLNP